MVQVEGVLLAALEHKSPFMSDEAKVPSVYEVLVDLVRLVDVGLRDDRISRHVLIHTIRIMEPLIVGACRGTSRVAAMADMDERIVYADSIGYATEPDEEENHGAPEPPLVQLRRNPNAGSTP